MCHVLIIEDEWLTAAYLTDLASITTACTEDEAVELLAGTGPRAVATISAAIGQIAVIFITGTPDACHPCPSTAVVLPKPVNSSSLLDTFRRLAPV